MNTSIESGGDPQRRSGCGVRARIGTSHASARKPWDGASHGSASCSARACHIAGCLPLAACAVRAVASSSLALPRSAWPRRGASSDGSPPATRARACGAARQAPPGPRGHISSADLGARKSAWQLSVRRQRAPGGGASLRAPGGVGSCRRGRACSGRKAGEGRTSGGVQRAARAASPPLASFCALRRAARAGRTGAGGAGASDKRRVRGARAKDNLSPWRRPAPSVQRA